MNAMKLVLLDRDGMVVVNRATNIKTPEEITLIKGAAEGIGRLNEAGVTVAICTNQPEVARGAMTRQQLEKVHTALTALLKDRGALIDRIFGCTSFRNVRKGSRPRACCAMHFCTMAQAPIRHHSSAIKPMT